MKKIVSLSLLMATSSLMAMYGEHAYLYKDPRIMGMGGANIAVGSYSTSIFSNPAGLAQIKKEHGYVVDILGIGFSTSEDSMNFAKDLQDAIDTNIDSEVTKVLNDNAGKNFHIGVNNYTSISKNSDLFAWSLGVLTAADINLMAHSQGSTHGGLLQTSSRAYGGIVLGGAKPFETDYGRVDVGVGIKFIQQTAYEGTLGVSELLGDNNTDNLSDTLQNRYEKKSSGFGIDLGVNYHPFADNYWNPVFGMSIMNIGSMGMRGSYGHQPTTVNIGASVSPKVPYLSKLTLAADYVDLFSANKTRIYNYSADSELSYSDYQDGDMLKRLRLGVGVGLIDSQYFSSDLNLGLYQGAYTAGLDIELLFLKVHFATFEEQLGLGSANLSDRRYMVQMGIGW